MKFQGSIPLPHPSLPPAAVVIGSSGISNNDGFNWKLVMNEKFLSSKNTNLNRRKIFLLKAITPYI